jgi:hypothetical protein
LSEVALPEGLVTEALTALNQRTSVAMRKECLTFHLSHLALDSISVVMQIRSDAAATGGDDHAGVFG